MPGQALGVPGQSVHAGGVFVRSMGFFNGLLNCQNYILGWRKWKNEIHARTLGGMTLTEKIRSSKTYSS